MLPHVLLVCCSLVLVLGNAHQSAAKELSDAELYAVIEKQVRSSPKALYVFPPGRNEHLTFVYVSTFHLFIFDSLADQAFNVRQGVPAAAQRKMSAYRAEFAYVVKKTVQDAIDNHPDAMTAKMIEILQNEVRSIQPKTISETPEPTLENVHISYKNLEGKHSFPSHLYATGRVKIGRNTHNLKTPLQYYSLPNMRVITK